MNEYLQWPTAWKAHGKCGPPESEGAEDPPVPLKCSFVPSPHFFAVSLPYLDLRSHYLSVVVQIRPMVLTFFCEYC